MTLWVPLNATNDVRTYSMADGDVQLSEHFKLSEFRCKDGSDEVLLDMALLPLLESIRAYYAKPITINSGYRTPTYNKSIGGATDSQHMKGKAADIVVFGIDPLDVYRLLDPHHTGGLGKYTHFTHIDVRASKARW